MTFTEIKANTRVNLNDVGIVNYSVPDLDDSIQDAYDDVVALTQCIIKKVTLNWEALLSYYDFSTLVTANDYLACVAIFNNVNNEWLQDNKTLRDFDLMGVDWELRVGTPLWWAALNHQRVAVYPKYPTTTGTFDLYYWAQAPTVINTASPLIAVDFQVLLTQYSTMDLLESFEEYTKAGSFWQQYNENLDRYKARVKALSNTDLFFRL